MDSIEAVSEKADACRTADCIQGVRDVFSGKEARGSFRTRFNI